MTEPCFAHRHLRRHARHRHRHSRSRQPRLLQARVLEDQVLADARVFEDQVRGTRLCPDLFGPGADKQDFRVFDFCFNFDFFREQPHGIETGGSAPLGARLFRARVQLLGHVQSNPALDPDAKVGEGLVTGLHGQVAGMNRENFIVRMHLAAVERFQNRAVWGKLSESDREALQQEVATLPSEVASAMCLGEVESRMFDLTALRLQLAHAEGDAAAFARHADSRSPRMGAGG
jgi:type I restriction enzyme, R subunit